MRIYNEHTENYIESLAFCITKDPASMEHWRCLHLANSQPDAFERFENVLQSLKEALKDTDCDVIHCADNDVFFISRSLLSAQLHDIAAELLDATASTAVSGKDITIYDMFHDWRTVKELLLSKTAKTIEKPEQCRIYELGDFSHLVEVFTEAKEQRKNRTPIHILLVEDDHLTRRLVAAGFKEEYALITAETSQEAVTNYMLHAPDVVFLDIGLPDQSGFAALQKIMEIDPEAYVVMFSGNSYLDNINIAFTSGAAGFIAKPFRKDKMRHYITDGAMHHRKSA